MAQYLLRLIEGFGEFENYTHHLIEAEDRQMVKYHYHRTLKEFGYTDAAWGDKHCLDSWDHGWAELDRIDELSDEEYNVLSDHLTEWGKV